MAGNFYWANSGELTLAASTALNMIQIKAPANQRVRVWGYKILDKSQVGGTGAGTKVRFTRSTAAFGTFTAGTLVAGNYDHVNPSNGEALQTSIGVNGSVAPTVTSIPMTLEVQSAGGMAETQFGTTEPLFDIPGGQSLQVELTSAGTPTMVVALLIEE